jgi:hypothetical protein
MVVLVQPKANVSAKLVAQLMEHIVAKWGRNDEKYWIGNLDN